MRARPRGRVRRRGLTSLHTSIVPNTTWRPSKKLSPMMITVAPPVVQPSLGLMALMQGVAARRRQRTWPQRPGGHAGRSAPLGSPGAAAGAGGGGGHAPRRHAKGEHRSARWCV